MINDKTKTELQVVCEAAQADWRENQDVLTHLDHNFALALCISRHVYPLLEAQVGVVIEECALAAEPVDDTLAEVIRSLRPDAMRELERRLTQARIDGAEETIREASCTCNDTTNENDLCYGHEYILKQKRLLTTLTQPAPEKEKESE